MKLAHYAKHHLQADLGRIVPLAFETYGRESASTASFFRSVCIHATGLQQNWQFHPFTRRWRTRIHAALQVGNARLIRAHLSYHHGMPMPAAPGVAA